MRITNNMIVQNTKTNINGNKLSVDEYNTQMTTQKKISRPSEDPVIAIRSLRLSTSYSHVTQYLDNNIKDAQAWLDVTETALTNMKSILTDIRTQCVNGSTDTLTTDDRKTILNNLSALADQVYTEGNADDAGRTVFTGYRTNQNLTFDSDEDKTTYKIDQNFTYKDLSEHRFYTGDVDVPEVLETDAATGDITTADCSTTIAVNDYDRIRLAYDKTSEVNSLSFKSDGFNLDLDTSNLTDASVTTASGETISVTTMTVTATKISTDASGNKLKDADGNYIYENLTEEVDDGTGTGTMITQDVTATIKVYDSEEDWEKAVGAKTVGDDEIVYIKDEGEFVFGDDITNAAKKNLASISTTYTKVGFEKGEARPEYYYDCVETTEDGTRTEFTKEDQTINYTIANATTLTVNTQASEVFDTSIQRDVKELINIVQKSLDANSKVDNIKSMMNEDRYKDDESQAKLQTYLDAAQKEADYADDNLQKTYEQYITNFDNYLQDVNEAITNVGSTNTRVTMTQTRVENLKTTIKSLKSSNEDRELSDVIIDYYAANNAYQSSLTAASKVNQQSLLNYL